MGVKGYKGFNKGLICRGKQYAENTVFEEEKAIAKECGMHFNENPFDVLQFYGFVNEDTKELNEFAEVEALEEPDRSDIVCSTKKLKIGARIGIAGLVKAFIDFTFSKVDFENAAATNTGDWSAATNTGARSAATNTGYWSAATNTGDWSAATNTGARSAATNTGDWSAATVEGKESFAIATGIEGKARGKIGCYIAVAEWVKNDAGEYTLADFKAVKVDGLIIKEDTFYRLKNGEFTEVADNE